MALINCPECGKSVSSTVAVCPGCGFGILVSQNPGMVLGGFFFGVIGFIVGTFIFPLLGSIVVGMGGMFVGMVIGMICQSMAPALMRYKPPEWTQQKIPQLPRLPQLPRWVPWAIILPIVAAVSWKLNQLMDIGLQP